MQSAANLQVGWTRTATLAFQCLGVIYGDIGTSPLYVLSSIFPKSIEDRRDLLGVLSLIIYTLLVSPLLKYALIVLQANYSGNGGTFALYSLITQHLKMRLIPDEHEDIRGHPFGKDISSSSQSGLGERINKMFQKSFRAKLLLLIAAIFACSMVIGDGILTPSISVLSAVGGIKNKVETLNQDAVVGISIAILVVLFFVQRFGTDSVGFTFAPIILLWFFLLTATGLHNMFKHDIGVIRALNPYYIIEYFQRNGTNGWRSLAQVILCITGTEAMFADLGHFNVLAVKLSFCGVVLPALLTTYVGQAAYLSENPSQVTDVFYASVPDCLYWLMFVVAVVASVIASQALISASFTIVYQASRLGCFPKIKVVHTSNYNVDQIYIAEVNYLIMLACIYVTFTFKTTDKISNAYGIAVVSVMLITTCLTTLVMIVVWKVNIWWAALFFIFFGTMEGAYLSSMLSKFIQGGYLPISFAVVSMAIMGIWHYVQVQRYKFEQNNMVLSSYMHQLATNSTISRVAGIGLLYTADLVHGNVPLIFPHMIEKIPSIHSILVFVSFKLIPTSKVVVDERFRFRHVEPRQFRIFHCCIRYGYMDKVGDTKNYENQLVERLKIFIVEEMNGNVMDNIKGEASCSEVDHQNTEELPKILFRVSSAYSDDTIIRAPINAVEEELLFVENAKENGVFHLLGQVEFVAKQDSSRFKKIIINNVYSFLEKIFKPEDETLNQIPRTRVLRIGMLGEI